MAKLNRFKIRNAIEGSMGVLAVIAQKCNVSRSAITQFFNKQENQSLLKEVEEEKERILDIAEEKLMDLIIEGNFNAIKLMLETRGRSRGYIERPQFEINNQIIDKQLNIMTMQQAMTMIDELEDET